MNEKFLISFTKYNINPCHAKTITYTSVQSRAVEAVSESIHFSFLYIFIFSVSTHPLPGQFCFTRCQKFLVFLSVLLFILLAVSYTCTCSLHK